MIETDKTYYLHENVTGREDLGCRFRCVLGEKGAEFCFDVKDEDLISPYREDNEDIWQGDAVEVFFSPDGDTSRYKELEVSPFGVRFYGNIFNEDGKTPVLEKLTPPFDASAERTEEGYRVAIFLPYTALQGFDRARAKMNAFRLDKKTNGEQRLYALNPTHCDSFHRSEYLI